MSITSTVHNVIICTAIAQQIIEDLNSEVYYSHESLTLDKRRAHENMIFERTIHHESGHEEVFKFEDIWEFDITNSECFDVWEALQDYSREYIKSYVQDVYPDWRDCMD